jgi:hypothetical protein
MKTRNIHKLLTILRKGVTDGRLHRGLCSLRLELYKSDLINRDEYMIISRHMEENAPTLEVWWFPAGAVAPRLEWIDEQLEKNPELPTQWQILKSKFIQLWRRYRS